MVHRRNWPRAAMLLGLAFLLAGRVPQPGTVGLHGAPLATAIALGVTSVGWIAWALLGPFGDSTAITVSVCVSGVAGSALLVAYPSATVCWFMLFACIDAGSTRHRRTGIALTAVCVAILLGGFVTHRGYALATYAAIAFVAYVIGRNRSDYARAERFAERQRLAAELHDILGHSLTALSLRVQAATAILETGGDGELALDNLRTASRLARAGQDEAMAAVRTLRDGAVGLHDLARNLIDGAGAPVELTVAGTPRPMSAATGMAVYRLLQEALTNAGKHAPGAPATVRLEYGPHVLTVIVDNPTVPGTVTAGGGQGLPGMRERVRQVGGTVTAGAFGDHWRVEAVVPG